ncbi:hypothetical protein ACFWOJ_37080 [Streptomyces sp. NPDC058439]|uniref:hypothetical protein n=1 Tax=Streptomyces sp. NPDC058439 TaxID=3346500 RepID=UPI00364C9A5C
MTVDDRLAGVLAASDTLRPEIPAALAELKRLGLTRIELLTGDQTASIPELVLPTPRP